jgi:phosphoribulokinase
MEPLIVPWPDAPARIRELATHRRAARPPHDGDGPTVVGITGPMAAGKSTLAASLGGLVLSTDRYLPDYEGLAEHEWDLPVHSDLARLSEDLARLRSGAPTKVPVWSFQTHSRVGEESIDPAPLIVVEGLHALAGPVRQHLDLAVLVDAPRDVRWSRCVERERTGERGWSIDYVERFFEQVAEPTFNAHGRLEAARAHLIVVP